MSDEQWSLRGCLIFVVIASLVGLGLRSQNITQFLVMGGLTLLGVLGAIWGISSLSQAGWWNKLWGMWSSFWAVVLVITVGNFLIYGDYDRALKVANLIQATGTPAPPAETAAGAAVAPTMILPTPAAETAAGAAAAPTTIPNEQVAEALNTIWRAPAQDAIKTAEELDLVKAAASDEGKQAAGLLRAVALERAGQRGPAQAAYQEIVGTAAKSPYAVSAAIRLRILENPERTPDELDQVYTAIGQQPDAEGWFLLSDGWAHSTTHQTAWQALVDLRSNRLSFRFFQYLRSQSPFPIPYAYLFILLALTIGVKILALPLYVRTAKLNVQLRWLNPQIQMIRSIYRDDAAEMNQQLLALYQRYGVNFWGGCALGVVDMIFVIWGLVMLSNFSPQLALDGARFWWISDVTQRDFRILLAWVAVSTIQYLLTRTDQQNMTAGQAFAGMVISSAVIVGVAWYWQWPAYVFIFWLLLLISGLLINRILIAIWLARGIGGRGVART